jgi:two-component sensor histidine kinase
VGIQDGGIERWVRATGQAVFGEIDGQPCATRFLGTIVDISDRKEAEEQIQASLAEKVVLLQEIHHRVKNNLQILISLLNLQSRYVESPLAVQTLQECQNRVKSMALIHEQLYQTENFAKVDLAKYIYKLIANLKNSYKSHTSIEWKVNIAPISLDLDEAISCGLIVNELISNSLKYAFPMKDRGEIQINFYQLDENYLSLSVKDNGIGIGSNIDLDNTKTLGLKLIKSLTGQLRGTVVINRDMGTEFQITFQKNRRS